VVLRTIVFFKYFAPQEINFTLLPQKAFKIGKNLRYFKNRTTYTLKTPVFEIASMLKNIRVEIFVLHNGKFYIEIFS
jgi:hypothetical protein